MQVGPLGLEPHRRLLAGAQKRQLRGRIPDRGVAAVEMTADSGGGLHVIVHQPADSGLTLFGVVGFRERLGVLADQVVQAVPAAGRLDDQMVVEQLDEAAPGGGQTAVVEGGGRVGINIRAGMQPEPAEQLLLINAEVLVRQVKSGGYRQVLGVHQFQPVP
jgi:hypothetical protein